MAVERVVTEVGAATHEPAGERGLTVIQYLRKRGLPLDQRGALAPERVAVDQRAAMRFRVGGSSRGHG